MRPSLTRRAHRGVSVIGLDVTRIETPTDLQDSEERSGPSWSQLPALAFIKDDQSRILFTNRYMDR